MSDHIDRPAVIAAPVAPAPVWSCGLCDRLRIAEEFDRDALLAVGEPRICRLCNGWYLQ